MPKNMEEQGNTDEERFSHSTSFLISVLERAAGERGLVQAVRSRPKLQVYVLMVILLKAIYSMQHTRRNMLDQVDQVFTEICMLMTTIQFVLS